jgi:DNA segregation ATPase FtsK/SpoIIIE, S-DNA-T family
MGDGGRLELRITVSGRSLSQDVSVTGSESHTVDEMCEQAAQLLGHTDRQGLWCERRRRLLDPGMPLGQAGIRWGDSLVLVEPGHEPVQFDGASSVALVVTAGPCSGQRWELGHGSYRLGRAPSGDLVVADPSLSRHHLDVLVDEHGVSVADAGSANGTAMEGALLSPRSYRRMTERDELELGRTMIRMERIGGATAEQLTQRRGRLELNRPPRVNAPVEPFRVELEAPPDSARKARLPLAASLLPLAAGLLLFVLLKSPAMLAIAGLSPMMAIGSYVSERRTGNKSFERRSAEFRQRLADAVGQLDAAIVQEAAQRRALAPDAAELMARLRELSPSLWERRPKDRDFLRLRLGVADLSAHSQVVVKDGGEPGLRDHAQALLAERATVPSVPLTVDLAQTGVLGLAGSRAAVSGLARWLLLQAAILHSPGDLVILAALADESSEEWSWLKWLPHARPDRAGLQVSPATVGRLPAEQLLAEIRDLLGQRRGQARTLSGGSTPTQLLVLIDEHTGVDRALVSAALAGAAEHGVAVVWLGGDRRNLPGQAGAIVEVREVPSVLSFTDVGSGAGSDDVSADALPSDIAHEVARLLAPLRDVGELAAGGDIPQRVGLLSLLGLLPPTAGLLEERWNGWQGELGATVGADAQGPFSFDLRDEGPHMLIAGTTGSGKSELLRTLVAAAAARMPPHRMSFLLIDYKGGAAFAPCAALPHVVDVVSDLDEHLAERALVSLNAELKRREQILAEHGAKDLLELARRRPEHAPPLLVIAVDEFAKLREEIPDFVDGVVDIAQRGRSLGVHMVLAAQTLRNAFTPAIRANTNLRVALRVADESESEDVISSPLAARIPSGERFRGRAFARTGHAELHEFQCAYISGRSSPGQLHELRLAPFELAAERPDEQSASGPADSDADSDLTILAAAAQAAQARMGLPTPMPPWMAPLPPLLSMEALEKYDGGPGRAAIGLIDLPDAQRQDPLIVDLDACGHVAVFGGGNSGRTTALTSAALALARQATPEQLLIYGLDAASGALSSLTALPHCAGVAAAHDEERVERLFRELTRRLEAGAHSQGQPKLVLMLDDLGAFAQRYDRPGLGSPYEQLQRVLSGGRAASVHVLLTAARRGALPAALAAHIGQRLVLRMASEEDMVAVGLDAKTIRGARLPAGRGFTQDNREFQIAVPTSGSAAMTLEQAASELWGSERPPAREIELLPARVLRASLGAAERLECVPLGIADDDLKSATVDLTDMHLLVVGPYRSGRSTALATLAHGAREARQDAVLHLLAPRRSPLRELPIWDSIAASPQACAETTAALVAQLEAGESQERWMFVFVDDGGELGEAMVANQLERLVRVGRDGAVRVVAAVETGSARGLGLGWIRELRRDGHGLLLQPDLAADGDLLGVRLPRRVAAPWGPGRGFAVCRGAARLVQVAV